MTATFWQGKKILVTGGAGFIGSNLAERLVKLGSHVRIVDNLERGKIEYLKPIRNQIEFFKLDLSKRAGCQKAVKDIDFVFHLASKVGGIGYYLNSPGEVILNNILIDSHMLQASLRSGVKRYLYASSAHVYPLELQQSPDTPPIKEDQAYPASPGLSYGWAKLIGEQQIEYVVKSIRSPRVAIIRLVGIFGKNQDINLDTGSVIPVFCRRAIEYPKRKPFIIWGTGTETRSYCYIDDAMDGLLLAMQKLTLLKYLGPVNLGSEAQISMAELAKMIIDISGKPITAIQHKAKKTLIWRQAVDCSKAKAFLDGWIPNTSLYDGLKETYRQVEKRLITKS